MKRKDALNRRESLQLLAGATALGVFLKPALDPAIPEKDECFTDPDGTEHVTRVVPLIKSYVDKTNPQFSNPNAGAHFDSAGGSNTTPTFGEITSLAVPARTMEFALGIHF